VDPETKVPYVFQKVCQHTFTAMYLLSTILNTPSPPIDLLLFRREEVSAGEVAFDSGAAETLRGRLQEKLKKRAKQIRIFL